VLLGFEESIDRSKIMYMRVCVEMGETSFV